MSRNLIKMTETIFSILGSEVLEIHKNFIAQVERRILIDDSYKEKCCDFLSNASIVGISYKDRPTIIFVKYSDEIYVGVQEDYAKEFETFGYTLESDLAINVGCHILSLSEKIYKICVESKEIVDKCLGIELEGEQKYVDFEADDIISLITQLAVFKIENNLLDIDCESEDDLLRISLLLYVKQRERESIIGKELIEDFLLKSYVRNICGNIWNFIVYPDSAIKYLNLYQCIEYLFIPNRAQEFKTKYNMSLKDALVLNMNEAIKKDERGNSLCVVRLAGEVAIHNMYSVFFEPKEGSNELEQVNNWIYDTRCSIAHFRYGQNKNNGMIISEDKLIAMLELLGAIYDKMPNDMKDICSGKIII